MDTRNKTFLVQGASRGIGLEFARQLLQRDPECRGFATCRNPAEAGELLDLASRHPGRLRLLELDVTDEASIESAANAVHQNAAPLHLVLNVAGVLHGPGFSPEKKLGHVEPAALRNVFDVNALGPLLMAKHFHPLLRHEDRSVFASLSARVGSISDNRLGGWYAYRASKAAQNMFTKNISIELQRVAPKAIVVGLHPGTVATDLSEPFQRNVPKEKLFTPEHSVSSLLSVIDGLQPDDTGLVFDFDGKEIQP